MDFPSSASPLLRAELFWALYRVNLDTVPVDQKTVLWFRSTWSHTCPQNASASSLPLGKTWALGKPFLMEKQMDSQEGQLSLLSVSFLPCDIVFPFTPTVWSPVPFLGCPPIRPLQPHLPEPHCRAFYFHVRVMNLSRDVQKQMGWFLDRQGVYDVIKIIDLEKKAKDGSIRKRWFRTKRARGHLGPQYLSEEILASCQKTGALHNSPWSAVLVNKLSDYDMKTYDGHTDVSTLTQAIALWKQYSDYLVLYIRFQRVVNMSLPCVKAPPSGFWTNPFSESAKQKTELGPSSYINSVCPLEVSPPPTVLFPIASTSLGQDQWMWLLWLAFSLSQPVLFSETLSALFVQICLSTFQHLILHYSYFPVGLLFAWM